ncbi:zinc finger protein 26-like isoform X8 [Pieris napi]|uniref:zinc finger protein 26-like isoform X8 n=1 Tax=Pieris napi TaxID=78633 RepID=UPI001FB991BF|nr:zinc finger protein 26-like isoform X8 [Pieris napi]
MEFDDVIVKENPGLCRCCLSEGCYKELATEYIWMGENEVYADMLLECFDISISQNNEGPNGTNRLICEVCITRLRDACNFKKQVLECEKKFVDMVGRGDFKQRVTVDILFEEDLKLEQNAEEQSEDTGNFDFLEEPMAFDDEINDDVTAEPLPVKGKRGRPKKSIKTVKKKEEKPKTSKAKELESEDSRRDEEKFELIRNNIKQVLLNSNIMPFRWLKTCFRCFFCYEMFESPDQLKIHQATHSPEDIYKTISNYYEETVFVDITNIICKLCKAVIDNLHSLINHLVENHAMTFHNNISLIPFRLDSCQCVICSSQFLSHGGVVSHMMKKHRHFLKLHCDTCQTRFSNSNDVCIHLKGDIEDTVSCMDCNKSFSEEILQEHMKCVHNKRYRCSACGEFFRTHYQRSLHMASVHKRRDLIKCLQCPQSFIFQSILRRHVKQRHLKEKNVICHICGFKTYGQHELKAHLVKHANTKDYKCLNCEKMFKSKKNMRQHCIKSHQ